MLLCLLWQVAANAASLGVHPEEPAPSIAALLVELGGTIDALQVKEFASQADIVESLQAGALDAALIEAPAEALEGVRLIADLYPSVLHILLRKDQPAMDLPTLLTSGVIWAGGAGSIGQRLVEGLIQDYGLEPTRVRLLPDPIGQTPDVWFIFGGLLNADALRRLDAFTLYSLGDSDAPLQTNIAAGIALRYPTLQALALPSQLYPQLGHAPMTTLAVKTQLVVRASLDDDAAYELAAMVDQARPVLAARYPFAALDDPTSARSAPHALAHHGGAVRFADRHKPTFLERYAEVFAFVLTALVALASATVALSRYRQQRRKDRLDRFFGQLLEHQAMATSLAMGTSHPLGKSPASAASAAAAIRGLQSEVIELVIAERISADGALLAFLQLSNQLLQEAQIAGDP